MPSCLRLDKGTETVDLVTMHSYLLNKHCDEESATDCVLYGPSTENKIERWWKELLERMEKFFKDQLKKLLEDGDYDRDEPLHRYTVHSLVNITKKLYCSQFYKTIRQTCAH